MEAHPAFCITGETRSGKTTALRSVISNLPDYTGRLKGWTTPAHYERNRHTGYDLEFIGENHSLPFCRKEAKEGWIKLGRFWFNPGAMQEGYGVLGSATPETTSLIVIDEIGPFDLTGKLWGPFLNHRQTYAGIYLLLVVRTALLEKVWHQWQLSPLAVWNPAQETEKEDRFLETLKSYIREK
ncbi:MAG: nucleoside-triphosphatase [Bacteroidales bacterium]